MVEFICPIVMLMLTVAFGAAFVRVVIGPTLPDRVIALDVRGKSWSTEELARRLADWQMSACNYSLLVGGPDGIDEAPDHNCVENVWKPHNRRQRGHPRQARKFWCHYLLLVVFLVRK